MTTLKQLTLHMAEFAKKICAEGDFQPMMHIVGKDDNVTLATFLFQEHDSKDARRAMLKRVLKEADAQMYVLGTEAWALSLKADKEGNIPPQPNHPIREDDRRKSVMFFSGEDREGNCIAAQYVIDEAHGRTIDLEHPSLFEEFRKDDPKHRMEGVNANLFEENVQ